MSAMRDHKIFRCKWTYEQAVGSWVAHDEFETSGYKSVEQISNIIAPNKETAEAWLCRYHLLTPKFKFVEFVETLDIAALIQEHVW